MTKINLVDPETLQLWLTKDEVILIDVRESSEYREAHIAQAISIPLSTLSVSINELDVLQKEKKIVMQCRVGIRSMMGCRLLKDQGFERDLWNLEGGIQAWQEKGLAVTK